MFSRREFIGGIAAMAIGQQGTGFRNQVLPRLVAGDVIINKNGLFMFSSLPAAKGNLVLAFAPGAGGTIAGNVYPSGFNFGVWDATGTLKQHFGIDGAGRLYLADGSGLTRIFLDPNLAAQLTYNVLGAGAGNLLTSIASAATVDSSGNTVYAGQTSYSGSGPTSVIAQLINGVLNFGLQPQFVGTGGATPGVVGILPGAQATGKLDSGLASSADVKALIEVLAKSQSVGGLPTVLIGSACELVLGGPAPEPTVQQNQAGMWTDVNGYLKAMPSTVANGDTNAYQLGEILKTNGGFTVNSTSPQTIMSCPVAIGTYVVEVWLVSSNTTAADAAGWAFTGPAAGTQLVDFESKTTGTAVVGYGASAVYTTTFNGQGVGGNQGVLLRALIQFTAAGTLAITGKELVAGNTIAVFGGWMRVRHVS